MSSLSTSIASLSISSRSTTSRSQSHSNSQKDKLNFDEMSCLICKEKLTSNHLCLRQNSISLSEPLHSHPHQQISPISIPTDHEACHCYNNGTNNQMSSPNTCNNGDLDLLNDSRDMNLLEDCHPLISATSHQHHHNHHSHHAAVTSTANESQHQNSTLQTLIPADFNNSDHVNISNNLCSSSKNFKHELQEKIVKNTNPRQPKTSTFDPAKNLNSCDLSSMPASKGVQFINEPHVIFGENKFERKFNAGIKDSQLNLSYLETLDQPMVVEPKIRPKAKSYEDKRQVSSSNSDKFVSYRATRDPVNLAKLHRDSVKNIDLESPPRIQKQRSQPEGILDFSKVPTKQTETVPLQTTPNISREEANLRRSRRCSVAFDTKSTNSNFSYSSNSSHPQTTRTETALLGTPDYIAPEVLNHKPHDKAVDFWALGCCMYQFMIGIPPFSDQSVKQIFQRINDGNIEWPDGEVSNNKIDPTLQLDPKHGYAQQVSDPNSDELQYKYVIKNLLHFDPEKRAGIDFIKNSIFFTSKFNFENLLEEQPPFIPEPQANDDIAYFEIRNARRGIVMSPGPMNMMMGSEN